MSQIAGVGGVDRRDGQTYAIIGAAMEVHRLLGSRFLESVYQSALAVELGLRQVSFAREVMLPVYYENLMLNIRYRADFV